MPHDEIEEMMTTMCRLQQDWMRACMGAFLFGKLPSPYRMDPRVGVGVAVDTCRRLDHAVKIGQQILGCTPSR